MRLLSALVLLACIAGIQCGDYGKNKHLKRPTPTERRSFHHVPTPPIDKAALPEAFSWGAVEGPDGKKTSLLAPSWWGSPMHTFMHAQALSLTIALHAQEPAHPSGEPTGCAERALSSMRRACAVLFFKLKELSIRNSQPLQYCGSCYLHGALSMVQDRISVATNGLSRVMLGRQVRVSSPPHPEPLMHCLANLALRPRLV